MAYFPLCMDLADRVILLLGRGNQIEEKMEKLRPFGGQLRRVEKIGPEDLTDDVAFVVVGDTLHETSARISALCRERRIPVNVVDAPELCTFFFPALITRGELTVSVSTGGQAPGAAGYLARNLAEQIPYRTEEILDWLRVTRRELYAALPKDQARSVLGQITRQAFRENRPLTREEVSEIRTACGSQLTGSL